MRSLSEACWQINLKKMLLKFLVFKKCPCCQFCLKPCNFTEDLLSYLLFWSFVYRQENFFSRNDSSAMSLIYLITLGSLSQPVTLKILNKMYFSFWKNVCEGVHLKVVFRIQCITLSVMDFLASLKILFVNFWKISQNSDLIGIWTHNPLSL